ncbi:Integrase core domain [Popillia japonica]|uniref:Integrase core domain n=1 Tax=Popillia japonica TaxID=7064 RepID=A0AAW1IV49_POPJA
MSKQDVVNELHKPARRNFPRRRVIIKGFDDLWQADLAEFTTYSRDNRGYNYILVVIDCFSKFVWALAVKKKSSANVSEAMHKILRGSRKPSNLQTDAGTEFYNASFKALMKKHNINHYSTYSTKKASIVERVIRTLKEKIYRTFSVSGSYKWIDILPKIIEDYNNAKHRTIGMEPAKVTPDHEGRLQSSVYNNIKIQGAQRFRVGDIVRLSKHKTSVYNNIKIQGAQRFRVGDIVRLSKHKTIFEKGYLPNWTTELFKITKANITNPATYMLEDMQGKPILGSFYEQELQKTKHSDIYLVEKVIRRKPGKLFVKWLGLPSTQNSWISKKDLL